MPHPLGMPRFAIVYRRVRRAVLARRRLIAALCAAGAVAAGLQAASAPPPATTAVLTASRDLPAGSRLSPGDLTEAAFTPASVPAGAVRDAAAAVGRTTTSPLRTGEPITDVRLLAGSLLAGYPGTVASPVRIGDPGAVALLQVGDRVDILAADPQGQTPPQLVAARAPVIALPQPGPADQMAQPGMTSGGLIVLAVPESTAADLAGAAVARYLSLVIDR